MMNRNYNGHVNVSETETLETCPKTLLGHFFNIQRVRKLVSYLEKRFWAFFKKKTKTVLGGVVAGGGRGTQC